MQFGAAVPENEWLGASHGALNLLNHQVLVGYMVGQYFHILADEHGGVPGMQVHQSQPWLAQALNRLTWINSHGVPSCGCRDKYLGGQHAHTDEWLLQHPHCRTWHGVRLWNPRAHSFWEFARYAVLGFEQNPADLLGHPDPVAQLRPHEFVRGLLHASLWAGHPIQEGVYLVYHHHFFRDCPGCGGRTIRMQCHHPNFNAESDLLCPGDWLLLNTQPEFVTPRAAPGLFPVPLPECGYQWLQGCACPHDHVQAAQTPNQACPGCGLLINQNHVFAGYVVAPADVQEASRQIPPDEIPFSREPGSPEMRESASAGEEYRAEFRGEVVLLLKGVTFTAGLGRFLGGRVVGVEFVPIPQSEGQATLGFRIVPSGIHPAVPDSTLAEARRQLGAALASVDGDKQKVAQELVNQLAQPMAHSADLPNWRVVLRVAGEDRVTVECTTDQRGCGIFPAIPSEASCVVVGVRWDGETPAPRAPLNPSMHPRPSAPIRAMELTLTNKGCPTPMLHKFAALVAHPLVRTTCQVLNIEAVHSAADAVAGYLKDRFTDHSLKLSVALQRAVERSWKTLELSLAGPGFMKAIARAEDAAFRAQVESVLASLPLDATHGKEDFRQRCLVEARKVRAAGGLDERPDGASCVQEISAFARFASPAESLDAEWRALEAIGEFLSQDSYPNLGSFLKVRPHNGQSILVVAVRYFFRREVVKDPDLHREHVFAQLGQIREAQDEHFTRLEGLLTTHGHRLEESIGTLAGKFESVIEQLGTLQASVDRLLQAHQLGGRPLHSRDSFSYRDDTEREQIRELRNAFRQLPPERRQQLPSLLRDLGKLAAVGGDCEAAEQDFKELTTLVTNDGDRADAWYNAYQVAVQKQDWGKAFQHFQAACQLAPARYAPFPLERYVPEGILGAGGFGVAFLCTDRNLQRKVVVKALQADALAGNDESLLAEARALMQVKHPGIVELFDCDHADRPNRSRPYLVMEYFENSLTLEEQVRQSGPLPPAEVLAITLTAAGALQAAHEKRIYHRDIKPGNLLVRKTASGLETKLIDFGLALKQELVDGVRGGPGHSILAASVAGTAEYAAPEQMGRLENVPVGPYSDIYGLGKTCCYALFATTRPLRKHWATLEPHLVDLLERSTDDNPHERPQTIAELLRDISTPGGSSASLGPVLTAFRNRLSASVTRSPLLKVSITKRGRIFDVSQLAALDPGLPGRLLSAVLSGREVVLDLRPRQPTPEPEAVPVDPAAMYDLLERRIGRNADLAKRETGVHALWLGYPLVTASRADRSVRAPLFLWPVTIEPEGRRQMHLRVAGLSDLGVRFNRTLAMWVRRELNMQIKPPTEEQLAADTLEQWQEALRQVWPEAVPPDLFDLARPLLCVPQGKESAGTGPQLLHACALGYFTWQNESLQEDVERLLENQQQLRGVLTGMLSPTGLARPAEEKAPAEQDRYLVSESDYSQEQVVWQARSGPGLVVHGPPGTGKSQTIVNVIADALAHGRTVLMVCQKQAATRVVFERLRAAGLSELCLEIHDPEQDRKAVFAAVRKQAESCLAARPSQAEHERARLAEQITERERELDDFARAFHGRRPRYGLSYRDMKTLEQRQHSAFPTVRPLEKLRAITASMSLAEVEEAARRAREVGRWFAEGVPLRNPWSFGHLSSLRHTGNLREQVQPVLAQLRSQDAGHQSLIRTQGVVLPLPADLRNLRELGTVAEEVLGTLKPLAASPDSLLLRWLQALRTCNPPNPDHLRGKAQHLADLARQVRETPLVPFWEEVARHEPDFRAVAGEVGGILRGILAATAVGKQSLAAHWLGALREYALRWQIA
jgi:serine/threonine protein kinase